MTASTRPSSSAGTWYPGDARILSETLNRYLSGGQAHPARGHVRGLIVPHAGLRYSGAVAGRAFGCLRSQHRELVVVVAPFHNPHNAPILITDHRAYHTPLGEVPIDAAALAAFDQELSARLGRGPERVLEDTEHSLEIQLPFLQHLLGSFQLLPVMLVDQRLRTVREVGAALAAVCAQHEAENDRVLLVASSDLSHFYPQDRARALDEELLSRVVAFDPEAVLQAEWEGVGYACGRGAIAAVLFAAERLGTNHIEIVDYATSGDVSGDLSSVVGYASAVIWEEEEQKERVA